MSVERSRPRLRLRSFLRMIAESHANIAWSCDQNVRVLNAKDSSVCSRGFLFCAPRPYWLMAHSLKCVLRRNGHGTQNNYKRQTQRERKQRSHDRILSHSCRKALNGSILVALRAGMNVAASDTVSNTIGTS